MTVSGVSTSAVYAPPQTSHAAPPPPATKVDSDGDHDGDKAGSSKRLLDVKA